MAPNATLSVSELTANIKHLLEGRFPFVRVAGEISNLSRPASGHLYFTLKDARAQIRVALFRNQRRHLARDPRNGEEAVCVGRVAVYEPRGEYQLIADTLDFRGAGDQARAFEALKRRLAAEGLFDASVKRPLPFPPRRITLITSPEGAALHDFLRIARRRYPGVDIAIYPVPVQGEQAAPAMVRALRRVRAQWDADVLVLCRGGGSSEDLWAYNDEALVRAIREDGPPVVSAVGHEIDFTLADFAADLRAPTPSAAAELLLPEQAELVQAVERVRARLVRRMEGILRDAENRVKLARERLRALPHPLDRLLMRVSALRGRLERALSRRLDAHERRLRELEQALSQADPRLALARQEQRLTLLKGRLETACRRVLDERAARLGHAASVLQAVSPLATLSRGYAILRREDGGIIREAGQTRPGERVEALLGKGGLRCRVEEVEMELK